MGMEASASLSHIGGGGREGGGGGGGRGVLLPVPNHSVKMGGEEGAYIWGNRHSQVIV